MRRRSAACALLALAAVLALRRPPPLREGVALSQAVYDREGRLLRLTRARDGSYRRWVPLAEISPLLAEATLLYEDRHFRRHPGVNPVALARAAIRTWRGGPRAGGSTIAMQLARVRYGLRTRSAPGKLRQIARALELELYYSKDEILEAYLNLAPYGGNIEGVGAACAVYFHKEPARLTLGEALTLAVLPQRPAARRDDNSDLQRARLRLLRAWLARHPEDRARAAAAARATPRRCAAELPFAAPHAVDGLLRDDLGLTTEIPSTLDLRLQELLERQLRGYIEERRAHGIRNAAALLADHRTREILAAVGSADFRDDAISGQVDGTRAPRSPGSALKPFVYALAFDQGLLHPLSLVKDAPSRFAGFTPENFDGAFRGPVSAREALIQSRNVPAVQTAAALADPDLYALLRSAGVRLPRGREHYGLALALGGSELTARELASLYAMLADEGRWLPLRDRRDRPAPEPRRLLSAEAAFLTLDILRGVPRPDAGTAARTRDELPIYWKTGTSHGFRDAWSVGIFGQFVLAVWVGEFDGEGNPAFVGNKAAAPLFFRIADALRPAAEELHLTGHARLGGLTEARFCAVSGALPNAHCPRAASGWFIPGRSPIRRCELHRPVLVDARGRRACRPGPGLSVRVHEFWPTDLLELFRRAGLPRRPPPPGGDDCPLSEQAAAGLPPRILSPAPDSVYALRPGAPRPLALAAAADADAGELHWFAGERYLGKAPAAEPLLWLPPAGRTVLRAVDERGRAAAASVTVEFIP